MLVQLKYLNYMHKKRPQIAFFIGQFGIYKVFLDSRWR